MQLHSLFSASMFGSMLLSLMSLGSFLGLGVSQVSACQTSTSPKQLPKEQLPVQQPVQQPEKPAVDAQPPSEQETDEQSGSLPNSGSADVSLDELTDEEREQVRVTERFYALLEKSPRRGTAFDRVYAHHVEFGTLDKLLATLQKRCGQFPDDSAAWQLLGLLQLHRGQSELAVQALMEAEKLRAEDPMASYYLGQAQAATGDLTASVASLQRALDRKPARSDLLEVYQQLVRMLIRAQKTDQSLEVLQQLEKLFPNDARVLEDIAVTLKQEGKAELAKARYEQLLALVRDDYKKSAIEVEIAELLMQLGDKEGGIARLENVLSTLKPDGWLFQDVRRRIDEIFLKTKDQDGLVRYYETWLNRHADDLDAMARLGRFLNSVGRTKESLQWNEKSIKLAPTNIALRKSMIDLLIDMEMFGQAAQQYFEVCQLEPANVDHLRGWGKTVMLDKDLPLEQRKIRALEIWQKILDKSPEDAVTHTQVAELCVQYNILEAAERLFLKAIALAPEQVEYREYLGEFLHRQKRVDEALAAWSEMTTGSRATAQNFARAAEIFVNFGFQDKAVAAIANAAKLEPKDFYLHIRAAKLHSSNLQYERALEYISLAQGLTESSDDVEMVIDEKIVALQGMKDLVAEASRLEIALNNRQASAAKSVAKDSDNSAKPNDGDVLARVPAKANPWYLLARYWEASRQWDAAKTAAKQVVEGDPRSLKAWTLLARVAETTKNQEEALSIYRQLASIDRRSRSEYWMKISELELQAKHTDKAVEAARQLVQAAPGLTSNYEFYSSICLKAGKTEEAIAALRKAVRIEPNESFLLLSLAKSLVEIKNTTEAIEVYFRALEKTDELEDILEIVKRLVPLYAETNASEKLVERLDAGRKVPSSNRAMTIGLAQFYRSSRDPEKARQVLESLYQPETRDTILLGQLAKLCRETDDLKAAITYQRQLVAIAPGSETELPLAEMLLENNQGAEARAIMTVQLVREGDPVRQLAGIDALIAQKDVETAASILEQLLSKQSDDWELLYRLGIVEFYDGKVAEADEIFKRLLAIDRPLETPGRRQAERLKSSRNKFKSSDQASIDDPFRMRSLNQIEMTANQVLSELRRGDSVDPMGPFGGIVLPQNNQTNKRFQPSNLAEAHVAALGWLQNMAKTNPAEFIEKLHVQAGENQSLRLMRLYDQLFLAALKKDRANMLRLVKEAVRLGGDYERLLLVQAFQHSVSEALEDYLQGTASRGMVDLRNLQKPTKKLSQEDLQLCVEAFSSVAPEMRYSELNEMSTFILGSRILGRNGNQLALMMANGGYAIFNADSAETPLKFLHQQAVQLNQIELVRKLESDVIDHGTSPSVLMFVLRNRIQRAESERFEEILERWSLVSEREIQGLQTNRAATNFATSKINLGEAEFLEIANAEVNTINEQFIEKCLGRVLPQFFKLAQKLSRNLPIRNVFTLGTNVPNSPTVAVRSRVVNHSPPLLNREDLNICVPFQVRYEAMRQPERLQKLFQQWQNEAKDTEDKACWSLYLANIQFWNREFAQCAESLRFVSQTYPEDLSFLFAQIYALRQEGKNFAAFELAKKIVAKDVQSINFRDMLILELALGLGDRELASATADRLASQSLPTAEVVHLISYLNALDMHEKAREILSRIQRSSAGTRSVAGVPSNPASGRSSQLGATTEEQARKVLSRTKCPLELDEVSFQYILPWRNNPNSERQTALSLLHKKGLLNEIIAKQTEIVKQQPDSLYEQLLLLEYHLCLRDQTKDNEQSINTLKAILSLRPQSRSIRFTLGTLLDQRNSSDAPELFLSLLRDNPNWTVFQLERIGMDFGRRFSSSQRAEAANILLAAERGTWVESRLVINLCRSIFESEDAEELGAKLVRRVADGQGKYSINFVRNLLDAGRGRALRSKPFVDLVISVILPTSQQIAADRWAGLDAVAAMNRTQVSLNGGQVLIEDGDSTLDYVMKSLGDGRLKDWTETLQQHVSANPNWSAGTLWLIKSEIRAGLADSALERIKEFLKSDSMRMLRDSGMLSWMVDTLVKGTGTSIESKLDILELVINDRHNETVLYIGQYLELCRQLNDGVALRNRLVRCSQARPELVWKQVEIAEALNRFGFALDAIQILVRVKPNSVLQSSSPSQVATGVQYSPSGQVMSSVLPGQSASRIRTPAQANPPSQTTAPQPSGFPTQAGSFGSGSGTVATPGNINNQLRMSAAQRAAMASANAGNGNLNDVRIHLDVNTALAKSRTASSPEIVAVQLFNKDAVAKSAVNHLLIFSPKPEDAFEAGFLCPSFEQFALAAEKDPSSSVLVQQLQELIKTRPDDQPLAVLNLLWQIRSKSSPKEQIVQGIEHLKKSMLGDPTALAEQDPLLLWYIASSILRMTGLSSEVETEELGVPFALAALKVARLQPLVTCEASILADWAAIMAARGKPELAEQKCREMLTVLATSNPDGIRQGQTSAEVVRSYGMPQFLQVMALSRFANKHGLNQLYFDALRQALGEKLPVADAEVSQHVRDLALLWKKQPATNEMYEILKLAVFPEIAGSPIRHHAILRDRTNLEVENVLEVIVARAAELQKLSELKELVSQRAMQRKDGPRIIGQRINDLAILTLIGIAEQNEADAKAALEEILALLREQQFNRQSIFGAAIAAAQARTNPNLATLGNQIAESLGLLLPR